MSHTNHLWPGSSLTFAMFIWSPKTSRPWRGPCHPRTVALFGKTKFQWAELPWSIDSWPGLHNSRQRKWRAPVAQRRTGPSRESWRLLLDDKSRSGDSRALSPAPKKRNVTWEQWVEPMVRHSFYWPTMPVFFAVCFVGLSPRSTLLPWGIWIAISFVAGWLVDFVQHKPCWNGMVDGFTQPWTWEPWWMVTNKSDFQLQPDLSGFPKIFGY